MTCGVIALRVRAGRSVPCFLAGNATLIMNATLINVTIKSDARGSRTQRSAEIVEIAMSDTVAQRMRTQIP